MSGDDEGVDGSQRRAAHETNGYAFENGFSSALWNPGRPRDEFDPAAIVIDPQVPNVVRHALRGQRFPERTPGVPIALARFRDPRPGVPPPPRSQAPAAWLGSACGVLLVTSIAVGIVDGALAFWLSFLFALVAGAVAIAAAGAAREGRPAIAGGLIRLPEERDRTEYNVTHAGALFHRSYVRPRTDLDGAATAVWRRAVRAANSVYRSESFKDKVIDAERVRADVPELLWRIAEELALISQVRFHQRRSVSDQQRYLDAVHAVLGAQQRNVDIGSNQVEKWTCALERLAERLDECDAARRSEVVLRQLRDADPMIRELVARAESDTIAVEAADGLAIDVDAVINLTNQAISELSVPDDYTAPGSAAASS